MSKTYIVSVGTSVITNYKRKYPYKAEFNKDDVLSHLRNALKENHLQETSAEIKTLIKSEITNEDFVFLLSTDTRDGKIAADILKDFIFGVLGAKDVEISVIDGLQVGDANRFKEIGVKNLLKEISDIRLKNKPSDFYLSVSGGFKAVVPYLTLAGMLYDIKVLYIFENTDELIILPPLPIRFDFSLFENIEQLCDRIRKEGYIDESQFGNYLKGVNEKEKIKFLFTFSNERYTFSEIGFLLYQAYLMGKDEKTDNDFDGKYEY